MRFCPRAGQLARFQGIHNAAIQPTITRAVLALTQRQWTVGHQTCHLQADSSGPACLLVEENKPSSRCHLCVEYGRPDESWGPLAQRTPAKRSKPLLGREHLRPCYGVSQSSCSWPVTARHTALLFVVEPRTRRNKSRSHDHPRLVRMENQSSA